MVRNGMNGYKIDVPEGIDVEVKECDICHY